MQRSGWLRNAAFMRIYAAAKNFVVRPGTVAAAPAGGRTRSSIALQCRGFRRAQAATAFDKKEKHPRNKAQKHDRESGGNAPEGAHGRATVVAVADDDVTGHSDE